MTHAGSRPGFTLAELMVATLIIAVLAMLVAAPIQRAREEAMMAAATSELSDAIVAMELYYSIFHVLPASYEALAQVGHTGGRDTEVCVYQLLGGTSRGAYIRVELRHTGVGRGVITEHPRLEGGIWETDPSTCVAGDDDAEDALVIEPDAPAEDDGRPGRRVGQRRR